MLHHYTIEGVSYGDGINGILPDNDGNIWMQFARTISWLNIKTGKISSLSEKDGFIKQVYGGIPVTTGGDLYFWGDKVLTG